MCDVCFCVRLKSLRQPVQSEECTLCVYAICCKCVADSAVDGYLSESNVLI